MRQTPFGVWNVDSTSKTGDRVIAAMRQTPFGVWNAKDARAFMDRYIELQ